MQSVAEQTYNSRFSTVFMVKYRNKKGTEKQCPVIIYFIISSAVLIVFRRPVACLG